GRPTPQTALPRATRDVSTCASCRRAGGSPPSGRWRPRGPSTRKASGPSRAGGPTRRGRRCPVGSRVRADGYGTRRRPGPAAGGGTPATGTTSPAGAPDITTASITVAGKSVTVLKNPMGLTLYYFTQDTSAKVACTGACATNWPPLIATSDTPSASPTLPGK